ncbi:aldehyde dehydrogenase family protein [Nocardioides xinjiangensis]|uniref:aldehyde dehydrogenase family protein n=1 Tax=Nocardioides xinjiangensis TaxID=2817376 RepID=UPI001B30C886|nr:MULTISPECIES: aldehyde dehydrogenase family protein [unclassified Nocardioides]
MTQHAGPTAGLPIDGAERPTADGWTFPVRNPATGERLWDVPDAGLPDAEAAVEAAWRAVHATGWSTDTAMRLGAVRRFQQELAARADDLAALLAVETGVPVALRRTYVDAPVEGLRNVIGRGRPAVTVVLTPATAPLSVALAEIGRVLGAGGSVVLKPAPEAASAALEVGRMGLDFLPRGVLNVVATRDVDVAIALTLDRRVDEVSFTGSPVAGERVRGAAGGAGKGVRLDLGGPAPARPADDDRLEAVVAQAAMDVAANAGQGCRLPASVIVPVRRYADALRAAMAAMEAVAVGDPLDPRTLCGPLRSPVALDRVLRYVSLARAEGGDVVLGGRRLDRDGGWWMAPTVIGGLDVESRLVREELLGPVLMVVPEPPGSSARA